MDKNQMIVGIQRDLLTLKYRAGDLRNNSLYFPDHLSVDALIKVGKARALLESALDDMEEARRKRR